MVDVPVRRVIHLVILHDYEDYKIIGAFHDKLLSLSVSKVVEEFLEEHGGRQNVYANEFAELAYFHSAVVKSVVVDELTHDFESQGVKSLVQRIKEVMT